MWSNLLQTEGGILIDRLWIVSILKEGNRKPYWVILPPTPDDIENLLEFNKDMNEEEIQNFYQNNLKLRKLREVVEELQTDEEFETRDIIGYAFSKNNIQNTKMLQAS